VSIRHPLFKVLAMYVVIALVSFAPLSSIQRAAQALDLNKLLVGGLVGAAGLLAISALAGPAAAVGAAGAAGTGFLGTLGGALGTLVSGVTGITAAMGTLTMGTMATLGLMVGGAAIGIMGLMGSGFVAVPALILGAGLLAYFWKNSNYRYGLTYDQRNSGLFSSPVFSSDRRLANRSQSGYSGGDYGGDLGDRVRSIFDSNRRDDAFFGSNRYVDSNGMIRTGSDFFARLDQFFNGRNNGVSGGVPYAPAATTDTAAPSTDDVTDADLVQAQEARKAAYERLIATVQNQDQTGPASAPGTTGFQSEEVQQAIRDYKAADGLVKEITGRLQHREKQ